MENGELSQMEKTFPPRHAGSQRDKVGALFNALTREEG